jgi:hypothetical protein
MELEVDKTKNNLGASPFFSGASIFFLLIRAKKTMNQTKIKLHILKCDLKTSNLLINTGYIFFGTEFENSGAMATGRPVFLYPCMELYRHFLILLHGVVLNLTQGLLCLYVTLMCHCSQVFHFFLVLWYICKEGEIL